jgi:two-component system cell cycle sensor histidine kinase/response regulator CckA
VTIRAKLYAAIVVTIAGLVLTAGTGLWGMDRLGDRFDDVQAAGDARALALQLKYDVTDVNGWQTAYGYDGGRSRVTFLAAVARFRGTFARARRTLRWPEEVRLLDAIKAAFDDFMRLDREAYAALQAGRSDDVRRIFLGPEITNFSRVARAAEELSVVETARASAQESEFRDARRDALRILLLAALVAGALVAVLLVTANDLARSAEQALTGT